MKTLVFFLEEPSAKEMLNGLLHRLIPADINIRYVIFSGKHDLEKNLVKRLKGWCLPDSVFVVMRDQDAGDCSVIKSRLATLCKKAKRKVVIRIACRELESFYLGDLRAVERGLGIRGLAAKQEQRKYRTPDSLSNPSEELERLTKMSYQKVGGSRDIAPHLDLKRNHSHSFVQLLSGIKKALTDQVS